MQPLGRSQMQSKPQKTIFGPAQGLDCPAMMADQRMEVFQHAGTGPKQRCGAGHPDKLPISSVLHRDMTALSDIVAQNVGGMCLPLIQQFTLTRDVFEQPAGRQPEGIGRQNESFVRVDRATTMTQSCHPKSCGIGKPTISMEPGRTGQVDLP